MGGIDFFDTEIGFDLSIFGMYASRDWSWKALECSGSPRRSLEGWSSQGRAEAGRGWHELAGRDRSWPGLEGACKSYQGVGRGWLGLARARVGRGWQGLAGNGRVSQELTGVCRG